MPPRVEATGRTVTEPLIFFRIGGNSPSDQRHAYTHQGSAMICHVTVTACPPGTGLPGEQRNEASSPLTHCQHQDTRLAAPGEADSASCSKV